MLFNPGAGRKTIDDERKTILTRGAILAFSLVLHAVVLYFALTARINIKIINFNQNVKRTDVILVPAPRIKYSGFPVSPTGPTAAVPSRARVLRTPGPAGPQAGPGGGSGSGGGQGVGREEGIPLGGVSGQLIGGYDKDKEDALASGFSLVYPADAMLNLATYAKVPEDAWLRPLRKLAHPPADFSRYLHPRPGTRESSAVGSGSGGSTGGPPGGFGTLKSPPAGVVAAFVPENVKTFDLSGWAKTVLNAVQKNWTLGADAWSAEWTGLVTIKVLVMKNGDLNGIDVSASSNIDLLDASARRAIDRSGPWPALPADFPDSSLEIQLVFHYGR
jgi:TonB family protein